MKGKILILVILMLLIGGVIIMGIKHVATKVSGDVGTHTEWNADHIIDDNVDCNKFQHIEHVIENRTDFPAGPVEGQIIYRTDENKLYIFDGADWKDYATLGEVAIVSGTNYWSCTGVNFHVKNPDTDAHTYDDAEGTMAAKANDLQGFASVELPHGAVVTKVIVYGTFGGNWALRRISLPYANFQTMATATAGVEDITIDNPTIDNQNWAYHLHFYDLDDGEIVVGARITYTL